MDSNAKFTPLSRYDMYSCFMQVPQTTIKRLATKPIGLDEDDEDDDDAEATMLEAEEKAAGGGGGIGGGGGDYGGALSAEFLTQHAAAKAPAGLDLRARFFSETGGTSARALKAFPSNREHPNGQSSLRKGKALKGGGARFGEPEDTAAANNAAHDHNDESMLAPGGSKPSFWVTALSVMSFRSFNKVWIWPHCLPALDDWAIVIPMAECPKMSRWPRAVARNAVSSFAPTTRPCG
jgi:hypothetical protein